MLRKFELDRFGVVDRTLRERGERESPKSRSERATEASYRDSVPQLSAFVEYTSRLSKIFFHCSKELEPVNSLAIVR